MTDLEKIRQWLGSYPGFEPFPKKRTQKVKKKRNDSWCIRTGGQAAEQRRPASKRAGEIQPRAE